MICSGDREPKARSLAESRRTGGWITNPSTKSTGFDPPKTPPLLHIPPGKQTNKTLKKRAGPGGKENSMIPPLSLATKWRISESKGGMSIH